MVPSGACGHTWLSTEVDAIGSSNAADRRHACAVWAPYLHLIPDRSHKKTRVREPFLNEQRCLSEGAAPQRLKSSLSLHSPGLPGSCVNRQDAAVWQHDATKMHEDTVTQTRCARSLRHITKHVNQHRQAQLRLILVQSCPLRGFDLQADVRGNSALGNRRAASSCESKTTQSNAWAAA